METEMQHRDMDMENMPVESTTGVAPDEELMYTTSDGVEYQSTINDISYATDLSDAQVAGLATLMGAYGIFMLVILAVSIVTMWKIFTKAGREGWESIVPIYNIYVFLKVVGRPGWWLLLLLIPFVNIFIAFLIAIDLAKSFGKSAAFGAVALFLFSIVGYVILAFGKDKYIGPGGAQASQTPAAPAPEAAPPAAPAV